MDGNPFVRYAPTNGCTLSTTFACVFTILSRSEIILSIIKIGASISPLSLLGSSSLVSIFTSGLTLCLVIWTNPNLLGGNILCFALSSLISSFKKSYNTFLFSGFDKSIKSTTIIPPISRRRNCLAISAAAIILTSMAVSSWLEALLERFPLFTSMT